MVATRKSSILGPDGRPFEVALLSEEMAQPTRWGPRSVQMVGVATGLTPERLSGIMRQANEGHAREFLTLAIEMEERYMHYSSQLQVRRLAFDTVPAVVDAPKGYPGKIVDAVHELVNDPGFRVMAADLQDGVPKGYSVVEPIWEYQQAYLRPVVYKHRDPRFFQFDRVTLSELRLADLTNLDGIEIPAGKFIVHTPMVKTGLPLRRGLARPVAWAFLVQTMTLQDWAAFAEIYGIPFRVGKYGPQASDEDKRTLLRAVRSIANDAAAIIPQSMELEFVATSGQHGETVFGNLIQYLDRNVSKVILGQTMTADEGSSLGQAKIHNEVRIDIKRADGTQTASTINRDLVQWFVAFNFGPQEVYPTVDFPVAEPEDIKAITEGVAKLVPLGLRVAQRDMRDKLALSTPEADDELLVPPAPPAPPPAPDPKLQLGAALSTHVGGCQCTACRTATLGAKDPIDDPGTDELDRLVAETDWSAIADPLLEQIFALAAAETTFDGVLRKLDSLRLDSGPLRERLAQLTAIARGIGDTRA